MNIAEGSNNIIDIIEIVETGQRNYEIYDGYCFFRQKMLDLFVETWNS